MMSGRILSLALLAGLVAFAPQAEARHLFWWQDQAPPQEFNPPDDGSYDPAADGQDADVQDMFNQDQYDQYAREMRRRDGIDEPSRRYDPSFYQPDYADPTSQDKPTLVYHPPKPKKPKIVKLLPAPPVAQQQATVITDAPPVKAKAEVAQSAQIEKVAVPAKVLLSGVTCAKGESIVASYGFLDISEKTCSGSSLVYSAVRGNSNYEVEVNSANGEVTAVRKVT